METSIQTKPLEFILDCNIATIEEKKEKLKGVRSIPNSELVIIEDILYMIESPKSNYFSKEFTSANKSTLYELGKTLN